MALIQKKKEKSDTMKMQLGEAIKNYYAEELTKLIDIELAQLKIIKAIFKVWVFKKYLRQNYSR